MCKNNSSQSGDSANTAAAAQASSPEIEALAAQSEFADLQRVGGNFWESGNTLCKKPKNKSW